MRKQKNTSFKASYNSFQVKPRPPKSDSHNHISDKKESLATPKDQASESDRNHLDNTMKTSNDHSTVPADNWDKFVICGENDTNNLSDNMINNFYIWTSDNDNDDAHLTSHKPQVKCSKNCELAKKRQSEEVLEESKESMELNFIGHPRHRNKEGRRDRVNSDMVSPQKKAYKLSQLMTVNSNWDEELNHSLQAELGEAEEHKDNKQEDGKSTM